MSETTKFVLVGVGIALAGLGVGYHVKEQVDHDELLLCRLLIERLNGTVEQ